MLSSTTVYDLLLPWIAALGVAPHRATARALCERLTAVLLGQTLTPADLVRTLVSDLPAPARSGFRRVARTWVSPTLSAAWLTPILVRAALALCWAVGSTPFLALDSVRCGGWEIFTVGLVVHKRSLLLGWTVLPYPWPKKTFTPRVCALLAQVAAAWPAGVPAPHLLADRGFPSSKLFRLLRWLGWEFTIRLRASDCVTLPGQAQQRLRAVLAGAREGCWDFWREVEYGAGPRANLVVGRGLPVWAWHQRDAGSARARARRTERRLHNLHSKHPRQRPDASAATDAWVILFSTCPNWREATSAYAQRWSIEGTYRDGQSGWDGRHGWNLEPLVAKQHLARAVEGIVGLWALALLAQTWVGDGLSEPERLPTVPRRVVRSWTVHLRLSVWARGRLAFLDHSGLLQDWLRERLRAGATRLQQGPPTQQQAA
jgi:hypothetical protein